MEVQTIPVEVPTEDGVVLRGQRWGNGPDWLILLHASGERRDLDDWWLLLPSIVSDERTVLTVDLRGHGASDGAPDDALLETDLSTLLAFSRENQAGWVVLVGAGDSATQILRFSSTHSIDASVLLSPVFRDGQAAEFRGRGEAKLFAVGSRTEGLLRDAREARNRSIGWAMLVLMPTEVQGVDLLTGPYASQLEERIVTFLAEQRMLARHALPRREHAS
jgi:pimeloyl-ACP methyl ester carboxylesterase